ncbi:hypothetical protein D9M70_525610 [compost metagenome]
MRFGLHIEAEGRTGYSYHQHCNPSLRTGRHRKLAEPKRPDKAEQTYHDQLHQGNPSAVSTLAGTGKNHDMAGERQGTPQHQQVAKTDTEVLRGQKCQPERGYQGTQHLLDRGMYSQEEKGDGEREDDGEASDKAGVRRRSEPQPLRLERHGRE